ncbi:MAG: hypothetical protein AAGK02_07240 [Pseudomonadota bacterium]
MSDALILEAEYADIKTVKTRKVVQLVFEMPIERFEAAVDVLGNPTAQTRVAIARLAIPDAPTVNKAPAAEKDKRRWSELPLPQQAGMRCAEPKFQEFMNTNSEANARSHLLSSLRVSSRAHIRPDSFAGKKWIEIDQEYLNWLKYPEERTGKLVQGRMS